MRFTGAKSEFFDKLPDWQKGQIIAVMNIIVVLAALIVSILITR